MSAFRTLKDICTNFETGIQRLSTDLFCAKVGASHEEVISRKLQDLNIYNSKFRLLHAKHSALTPQISERVQNGTDVVTDYEKAVQNKVLEQAIVKSVSRSGAIQDLITTPDSKLNEESVALKEKLVNRLKQFRILESNLHQLDSVLKEKEDEHAVVRQRWDETLGALRDQQAAVSESSEVEDSGPLYNKLRTMAEKMEMMRWLIGCLVNGRSSHYDWLSDSHNHVAALAATRRPVTVHSLMRE